MEADLRTREAELQQYQEEVMRLMPVSGGTLPGVRPTTDAEPQPDWEHAPDDPVLIAGRVPEPPPIEAQDEADFLRPFNWERE